MDQTMQAFYSGTLTNGYDYFGAHLEAEGWHFRVWAPNAYNVELYGSWNNWQPVTMFRTPEGVWELHVPEAKEFDDYKYLITKSSGEKTWKSDPYAFHTETRPDNSSKLYDLSKYKWHDAAWKRKLSQKHPLSSYMNIYEIHLGSWKIHDDGNPYSYLDLARELPEYVKSMGYNYVEMLPITEYPLDDSWGYQCTGYYAPTSRYGTPDDFRALIDALHKAGIGVILDWVPAHFCKDSFGLMEFDGTCLYEYSDPLKWEHAGWGTRVFDFGKGETKSFLLSSAAFWLREYHLDGLRVDAVASMLYLDYDRDGGQWRPNVNGGRENLEAVAFLQDLNRTAFAVNPNVLMIAEESTAWPLVTYPPDQGGLGFNLKWNMGWVNDISHYLKMDPYFRQNHHKDITFSMMYAFSENFVLPVSHDEVVHMKGSLRGKMPGNDWNQLAGVRGFYGYMMGHPGKKLTFMGTELGQWHEWNFRTGIDWFLMDYEDTRKTHECIQAMNSLYKKEKALWENDRNWDGFEWLVSDDNTNNVVVFRRTDLKGNSVVVVTNFSPVKIENYRFGVPAKKTYEEIFNTDDAQWGGTDIKNGVLVTEQIESHGKEQSIAMTIPPLATVILKGKGAFRKTGGSKQ